MAAGIAYEAGKRQLVEADQARAEEAAGGFAEGTGVVAGVSWHVAAARVFWLGALVQEKIAELGDREPV